MNKMTIQYTDISIIYGNIPPHSSAHVHTRSDDNGRDAGDHDSSDTHGHDHDNHNVRLLQILRIPRNLALLLSCDDDDDDDVEEVECDDAEEVDGEAHSDDHDDDDDAGRCSLQDPEPVPESQESLDLWLQQAEPLPSWL